MGAGAFRPFGTGPAGDPAWLARRRRWGPLLVLLVLVAELVAFVALGQLIGFGLTVLLVLLASLAGGLLLKREGLRAWRGFREASAAGTPPGRHLTDGVVGLGGAALLAVPGLLTGLAGLVLLLPPVRAIARARVQARAERRMSSAEAGAVFGPRKIWVSEQPGDAPVDGVDEVVEGEIVEPGEGPVRRDRGAPGPPPGAR